MQAEDLSLYISHVRTLTHAWFANPFHSCELLRKFDDEMAYIVHQSYMEFPNVTRLCGIILRDSSNNAQAVFSSGASVVTSLSPAS